MIHFEFEKIDCKVPDFNEELFCSVARDILMEGDYTEGDVAFQFGSDDWLLDMNRTYLNHDYYTDIITFDYSDSVVDISLCISVERVADNANQGGVNEVLELLRVMFHGLLHTVGYDDKTPNDVKLMRDREEHYLTLYTKSST